MIELHDAIRMLAAEAATLGVEEVELAEAPGRVLADSVVADRDYPPTDRSAMDGFALRAADVPTPGTVLRIVGEIQAGHPADAFRIETGQAVRIFTGAVVPAGADTVVMVERTEEDRSNGTVEIGMRPGPGDHIRPRGQDRTRGQAVLEPGTPIHAPEVAALASVGCTRVPVFRAPIVHTLTTGDEVVEPSQVPSDHQIRNSNAPATLAQLRRLGVESRYLGIASDTPADLEAKIERGLTGDLLLVTGGVSVGEYDLVASTLAAAGMRQLFHGVRLKPGKPMLAGRAGRCLVVGLPGNPLSTFVGIAVLVAPALRKMLGYTRWENVELSVRLEAPLRAREGRKTLHLARIEVRDGALVAHPTASTGSGDVFSMTRANGFVVTDGGSQDAGSVLSAILWKDFELRP